jgi:membrane protein DedA with SNARE-associated domain
LHESCGIFATFLGTLIGGEILLLRSIFSAKLGMFSYSWTLVAGFLGAYIQAWIKFLIAKKHVVRLLNKKPSLRAKLDKASVWFDKRPYAILSVYKLFYGMTTIIILMAVLKDMSYVRFGFHLAMAIGI